MALYLSGHLEMFENKDLKLLLLVFFQSFVACVLLIIELIFLLQSKDEFKTDSSLDKHNEK